MKSAQFGIEFFGSVQVKGTYSSIELTYYTVVAVIKNLEDTIQNTVVVVLRERERIIVLVQNSIQLFSVLGNNTNYQEYRNLRLIKIRTCTSNFVSNLTSYTI